MMIKFEKKDILRLFMVIGAALLSAVNINAFVNAGGLFPGGFSGVTLMIQRLCERYWGFTPPFTVIQVILNIVPAIIAFKYIGKKFTLFSLFYLLLSSVLTDVIRMDPVTEDILLISIFGGILAAVSGSVCLWAGTCGAGTDFISKYLTVCKGMDGWQVMLYCNCALLIVAGLLFGWDKALYSIIYQYTATQVVGVLYKKYKQDTLFIITDKPHDVSMMISERANHGATIFCGKGAYNNEDRYMVYSMVSADESKQIIKDLKDVDGRAFVNRVRTEQVGGNFYIEKEE